MTYESFKVSDEPTQALEAIRSASRAKPVLVFKKSPICPVSHRAEAELNSYLASLGDDAELSLVLIDVIAEKPLARGLTAELDVQHESPQALWFQGGELDWHGSHGTLTKERFSELAAGAR